MKVFVGMSGGVDSSLAASLLVEAGHDVTGVYMKNWTQDLPGMKCPWADDLADAKRVAVALGIDFMVFDFENEYKKQVVDYMIDEYKIGRTPNPDIMCNQEVKFKLFLDLALKKGADMIATGHYARVDDGTLKLAKDENKDQTYFLYRVSADALKKTIFPLGNYTKPQVRDMASKRGLYTANKKDSVGICFVGKVGIKDFLSQYVKQSTGKIIDRSSGKVIGTHEGAIFYTIGQRHGLEVGGGLPYYVVGKNIEKNEIYVSTDLNNDALWRSEMILESVHWINSSAQNGSYKVRVRHRASLTDVNLENISDGKIRLFFSNPERAVAPGQSIVIYDGETCMGGGIVTS